MKWRILSLGAFACFGLVVFACGDDPAGDPGSSGVGSAPDGSSIFRAESEAGAAPDSVYGITGAPTSCRARPLVDPNLVRACVLRASCAVNAPYRISDCIAQDLIATEGEASCMRRAATCDAMNECGIEGYAYSLCKFGDKNLNCFGSKLVDCSSVPPRVQDCAKAGKTCFANPDGGGSSILGCIGTLIDYPSEFCPSTSSTSSFLTCGRPTADGGPSPVVGYCQYGGFFGVDCSPLGQVCVDGDTSCRKPAPSCATAGATCSGSVLRVCTDGRLEQHDCVASGLECRSTNGVADCLASDCTSDDVKNCTEQCDGPYANLCVGGARVTVDCREYGATRCKAYASQDRLFKGQDYVRCLPQGVP